MHSLFKYLNPLLGIIIMSILRSIKSPWKCAECLRLRRGHLRSLMLSLSLSMSVPCTNFRCVIFQSFKAALNKDMTSIISAEHTNEAQCRLAAFHPVAEGWKGERMSRAGCDWAVLKHYWNWLSELNIKSDVAQRPWVEPDRATAHHYIIH